MKIKDLRIKQKLTQDELAKKSGVPQATISGIESGRVSTPAVKTILNLASALKVDPRELIKEFV